MFLSLFGVLGLPFAYWPMLRLTTQIIYFFHQTGTHPTIFITDSEKKVTLSLKFFIQISKIQDIALSIYV